MKTANLCFRKGNHTILLVSRWLKKLINSICFNGVNHGWKRRFICTSEKKLESWTAHRVLNEKRVRIQVARAKIGHVDWLLIQKHRELSGLVTWKFHNFCKMHIHVVLPSRILWFPIKNYVLDWILRWSCSVHDGASGFESIVVIWIYCERCVEDCILWKPQRYPYPVKNIIFVPAV